MTESKICTCPSGDGSLRWPCPAHPAEQAGGDERAAFEVWIHTFDLPPQLDGEIFADERYPEADCFGQFVYDDHSTQRCWAAWQARAALAQPSPALPPFAEKVLAKLRRFYDCASDFESGGVDIGRHWLDLLTQLGLLNRVQRSPALWEISQQGEDLLGMPQPSPAQAEQATADDYEEVLADHRRLVRELDVLLNGEEGAAKQASLCDLVAQVRTLRLVHDNNVPTDNLGQSLLMLEFALMFALCNFQHAGSRNDVKKAQTRLQEVLRFLSGKAKGFHLNTTELGYCAENPDVLRALAYEHDARAAAAEAIDLSGAVNTHEARAAVLRAEAKRIEDEL